MHGKLVFPTRCRNFIIIFFCCLCGAGLLYSCTDSDDDDDADATPTQTPSPTLTPTPQGDRVTWYVRPDGGTAAQCTGTVDAAYPGSGLDQPCAWSHPFWALNAEGEWRIAAGDTLLIDTGDYMMGYGAPNTDWCDPEGSFACHLPPVPSGIATGSETRILGRGHDSGCPFPPSLWGTERAETILNLAGSSHIIIECLELTDHAECAEFHRDLDGNDTDVTCQRDEFPHGPWAAAGIVAADSSDVTLRNLDIHGFASAGIYSSRLTDWTVEKVRIAGNGSAGWNGDDGSDDVSNAGFLRFTNVVVEWNGCVETWPDRQPDHCWAQEAGGYGDGFGFGSTGGDWTFDECLFRYNTSDGLDLLYLGVSGQDTSANISRTMSYGNAGNPIKVAGSSTIINSLMVSDCSFFSRNPFGQFMSEGDHCRAMGNALALSPHRADRIAVINSTIVGEGDCLVEIECDTGDCDGSEAFLLQNNVLRAYTDWRQPWESACFLWDPQHFATGGNDYNLVFNAKDNEDYCRQGPHNFCDKAPLFVSDTLYQLDAHLQVQSPAVDSGLPVGSLDGLVPAVDLEGNTRPVGQGVDRGAYEYHSP